MSYKKRPAQWSRKPFLMFSQGDQGRRQGSEEGKDFPSPLYKWGFDHSGAEQESFLTAERKTYKHDSWKRKSLQNNLLKNQRLNSLSPGCGEWSQKWGNEMESLQGRWCRKTSSLMDWVNDNRQIQEQNGKKLSSVHEAIQWLRLRYRLVSRRH